MRTETTITGNQPTWKRSTDFVTSISQSTERFVQLEIPKKGKSRYRLRAVCGESRTYSSEREVSRSNTGIDPN